MNWFSSRLSSASQILNNVLTVEEEPAITGTDGEPLEDEFGFLSHEESIGINPQLLEFVSSIASHPKTFLDFPEDELANYILSNMVISHAKIIIKKVPQLNDLRFKLCPVHLRESRFWMVYFLLTRNKLNTRFLKWQERTKQREIQKKQEQKRQEEEEKRRDEDKQTEEERSERSEQKSSINSGSDSFFGKKFASSLFDSIAPILQPSTNQPSPPSTPRSGETTEKSKRLTALGIVPSEESPIEEYFDQKYGVLIAKSDSKPNSPFREESFIRRDLDSYFAQSIDFEKDDYEEEYDLLKDRKDLTTALDEDLTTALDEDLTTALDEDLAAAFNEDLAAALSETPPRSPSPLGFVSEESLIDST
ncbi:hypothetical protein PROFUN_10885 [Planoprotostelium fungivorum]|uniref:BSD domain-containing protein n=1 Tax=Planoprotostelium fungivorum TaxID=1890364 RepID=A0A2P6NC62_9EUKA|nr:hypothetical protein PROFUN_10885 [Planoprotostelium fungivorum]